MNKIRVLFPLVLLLIWGESFPLYIRVEIGRAWRELRIASSTPFSLNISNGKLPKQALNEVKLSFLKKTQRFFCLRFTCPNEDSALKVEREVKILGYEVEREGREVVVRCELEAVRRALKERIKGEGIVITPFEEELKQARLEVEVEGERMILPSDARLRLIPTVSEDKGPPLFAVSINSVPFKKFRGELDIFVNSSFTSELINELDLEDYLKGVLPGEIPPDFLSEALRAQAIVARTYAVYSLGRHKKEGFDLCSGNHCQIYIGYDYEKAKLNNAIEETRGIIVSYAGKPALTPFHTCCGGVREDAGIWGTSFPYLRANCDGSSPVDLSSEDSLKRFLQKREGFNCESAPSFRWVQQYVEEELQKLFAISLPLLLNKPDLNIGRIKDIKVVERHPSGRVRALKIEMEESEFILRGDDIRWAFGDGKPASKGSLPSLLFYIEKQKREEKFIYKVVGGGVGHGVGFCQWGALGLAKKGYDYRQIINHYFPGTTLKNLYAN